MPETCVAWLDHCPRAPIARRVFGIRGDGPAAGKRSAGAAAAHLASPAGARYCSKYTPRLCSCNKLYGVTMITQV